MSERLAEAVRPVNGSQLLHGLVWNNLADRDIGLLQLEIASPIGHGWFELANHVADRDMGHLLQEMSSPIANRVPIGEDISCTKWTAARSARRLPRATWTVSRSEKAEICMLACVDVDYRDDLAIAACLTFSAWQDSRPVRELTEVVREVEPYRPGEFFRRELPCLMQVLGRLEELPSIILIDGYVWLGHNRPGLGAHLHQALGGKISVVGVAKTRFAGATPVEEVLRGQSSLPLFVSAVGCDLDEAAEEVRTMHGAHRLPTLLKRVDQLCRGL
jgi:deoxyribonuclease V